mmetsp:Transcript_7711/g.11031  ORF Transcript_7711/g.11031 Transcript_7711/m.11031 type:complete len:157 (-) Transcript_7711:234-704(-)
MSFEDGNSSSDAEGPRVPSGSVRKGWAGEELEMEHQQEQLQRTPGQEKKFTAVDITQFQNFEVGSGYQARHVVRQSKGPAEPLDIKDMRHHKGRKDRSLSSENTEIRRTDRPVKRFKTNNGVGDNGQNLNKYLQCVGIREFRRELEQLISSDKSKR